MRKSALGSGSEKFATKSQVGNSAKEVNEMADKDSSNKATLYRSTSTNERAPGYTGKGEITCQRCGERGAWRVSAWVNQMRDGKGRYVSLKFQPRDVRVE